MMALLRNLDAQEASTQLSSELGLINVEWESDVPSERANSSLADNNLERLGGFRAFVVFVVIGTIMVQ